MSTKEAGHQHDPEHPRREPHQADGAAGLPRRSGSGATPYDEAAYAKTLQDAVDDVVRRQVEAGIDVIDDGEMGKSSWITYLYERMTGLELRMPARGSASCRRAVTARLPRGLRRARPRSTRLERAGMVMTATQAEVTGRI